MLTSSVAQNWNSVTSEHDLISLSSEGRTTMPERESSNHESRGPDYLWSRASRPSRAGDAPGTNPVFVQRSMYRWNTWTELSVLLGRMPLAGCLETFSSRGRCACSKTSLTDMMRASTPAGGATQASPTALIHRPAASDSESS
jgi:hypothetical protein